MDHSPLYFLTVCVNVMNMATELLAASDPIIGAQNTWKQQDVRKETVLAFEIRIIFLTVLYR